MKYCVLTLFLLGATAHSVGPTTVVRNTRALSQTALSNDTQCERSALRGMIYVDGDKCTIESAIATANKAGSTTVIVSTNQMVSQPLTLSGPSVRLVCENGATLTAQREGFWMLTLTGQNEALHGCTLSANHFPRADAVLISQATNPSIEGNTIIGFGPGTPAIGVIRIIGSVRPVVCNNWIVVGVDGPVGIFGERDTTDADVKSNFIDESLGGSSLASHAIAFHSTTARATVSGTRITNNTLLDGRGFCVEIGSFGGLRPSRIVVSNNTCTLAENGAEGGYSLSGVVDSTESGNTFDANGRSATIAAYEIVLATDVAVTGNTADIGTAWASTSAAGATINRSSNVSFSGNVINGWGATTARGPGFGLALVSASVNSARIENNSVSGNVFIFPRGLESGGIWQQCQAPESVCSNNNFAGNVLTSDGSKGTVGFRIENDLGTTENTVLSGNTVTGTEVGIDIWDAGVTGTRIYLNSIRARRFTIVDHGTETMIHDSNGASWSSLGTQANGSTVYCSDCTTANPCKGGGTGALAQRVRNAWICN